MTLLEKLRLGFLARTRREKTLAVVLLVALAALWLVWLGGRVRAFAPKFQAARDHAKEQANWFALENDIQERYARALNRLSSQQLPRGQEAYAVIDQKVRGAGFQQFRAEQLPPNRREQITFFPINVTISRADYFQLEALFRDIVAAVPTVNLDEVTISAPDRNNGQLVDAKFKFVAIEINR